MIAGGPFLLGQECVRVLKGWQIRENEPVAGGTGVATGRLGARHEEPVPPEEAAPATS